MSKVNPSLTGRKSKHSSRRYDPLNRRSPTLRRSRLVQTAQTLARHSDIRLTMNVYSHVDEQEQAEAIARLPGLSAKKGGRALFRNSLDQRTPYLLRRSDCYRLERLVAGWELHPLKIAAFARRT